MEWHCKRLGVATLQSAGFSVIVLDCTRWINYEYNKRYQSTRSANPIVHDIGCRDDLIERLNKISDADHSVIFDSLSFSLICSAIRILVYRKKNILTAKWNMGLLPSPPSNIFSTLTSTVLHKDKLVIRFLNRFIRLLTEKIIGPPDIALLSGELSLTESLKNARYKIWAHSFDYDEYLEVEQKTKDHEFNYPYIVYLDEDIVDHPDLSHAGLRPVTTATNFYPRLKLFFEKIELEMGMPVIVAAHPKSRHDLVSCPFGDRTVRLGQTPELVRGSSLVLGHASCSLNFAMLWKKPVSILTSLDLNRSYLNGWIQARANVSNAVQYNIDDYEWKFDFTRIYSVDRSAYNSYLQQYVKIEQSSHESLWKIFTQCLAEISKVSSS
jgi:hypothetical protein